MKKIISVFLFLFIVSFSFAQTKSRQKSESYKEMQSVMMARQLAKYGYDNNKPIYLITSAQTLIDHPVKGDFTPLKITDSTDTNTIKHKSKRTIKLDPSILLADAKKMADKNDTALLAMIKSVESSIPKDYEKKRGRKFSPLAQEYTIDSQSSKSLLTTFNGKEVAEVLVSGDGKTDLDLFVYDASGKLVSSDISNTDNCYVTFTPNQTANFTIIIKNKGKGYNDCMLMTN